MNRITLIESVRRCEICAADLPLRPNPIIQFHSSSRILIAGQAPGRVTHEKGIPFDDASGNRLRTWMGIDRQTFYDETQVAVVPMGFCYPGTGKGGDLPPRKECAETWRDKILKQLNVELTLVIGQYAQSWHLGIRKKSSVTQVVKQWESYLPQIMPLPHPSPRNNIWIKKNPWFEAELLPELQSLVARLLSKSSSKSS